MIVARLMPEVLEVLRGQPSFQVRPRIDSGRSMALEIHEVARLASIIGMEEMVVTDLFQRRQRRECRDVPADPAESYLFARTTMHMAFQRTRLLIRRSSSRSPG